MDLMQGWGLDDRHLRTLRLLEHLADGTIGGGVPTLPEWAPPDSEAREDAIADLRAFDADALLDNFSIGGGNTAHARLSGRGTWYVNELRTKRDDLRAARDAAPNAMLAWLDDWDAAGHAERASIDDFVGTRFGTWFGNPFPDRLILRANDRLYEEGLIEGPRTDEAGVVRPALTTAGERLLRSGRSFHDGPPTGGDTYISNQTGQGSFAQQGPGGVINATVTNISTDQRAQTIALADALERTIRETDQPVPPDLADVPDELRAAQQSNDVGRLSSAVQTVRTAGLGAFGAAMGTDVWHPMHQLLQSLGLLG